MAGCNTKNGFDRFVFSPQRWCKLKWLEDLTCALSLLFLWSTVCFDLFNVYTVH